MLNFKRQTALALVGLILFVAPVVFGQKAVRVEKIVADAVRASGGKKRLAAIKNTVYEWNASGGEARVLRFQTSAPGAWRIDVGRAAGAADLINDSTVATNGSAVWRSDANNDLRTLSDAEAKALRLQAVLAATRLVDFNKQRIGAQIVGQPVVENEATFAVEFAARNGAKMRYYFGANSKLPVKIENPALAYSFCFGDYREENGVLEPHKFVNNCGATDAQTFELARVSTNANLTAAVFDPPRTIENFDIAALLAELQKNERELQARLDQYSFVQTSIERDFDDKGAVKKETRKVYEVFPTRAGKTVLKLVSENGVELAGEKLEKENQRVAKELTEAEEDYQKEQAKRARQQLEKQKGRDGGDAPDEAQLERNTIATLLKISEIYAPRVERFRDRDTIVVNFRPRAGFKPGNLSENVFSKLAGTAWIDRDDKQIIRAEARVVDNISFGGFLAKFRKDSALVFERAKFENEIWLPRLFQANASARFLFKSFDATINNEYGDYKKYSGDTKDYKLDSPDKNGEKP